MKHTIVCPLYIRIGKTVRSKKHWLSMNNLNGWHHHTYNDIKTKFTEFVQEQVLCLPPMKNIEVTYTVIRPDNRMFDLSNTCAVIDKFFLDCLSKFGKIPDDNTKFVKKITFMYGGIDKNNGRCIVEIKEVCDGQ